MGQTADVVECWDKTISQSYLSFASSTNGTSDGPPAIEGDALSCGYFQKSLKDLGVPSLADVDPKLKADLDNVATNGIPK